MNAIATAEDRPVALVPHFEGIPDALLVWPHFMLWRYERPRGKWTKPPFQPEGQHASSTDPTTWRPFEDVVAAYVRGGWDGIGIALVAPRSGVDLDNVVDPDTGEIHPEALRVVREINSYTERSPGGRGLRIFTTGRLPAGRRNARKWHFPIEVYDGHAVEGKEGGRYLTVTGHHLPGTPLTVEERTAELAALHARVSHDLKGAVEDVLDGPAPHTGNGRQVDADLADVDLLERARRARHGDRFRQLYDLGDCTGYGSRSEADLALCSTLAFWTNRDPARTDRLFRGSALLRSKWDERHGAQTYGAMTVGKAIAGGAEGYAGRPGVGTVVRAVDAGVLEDDVPVAPAARAPGRAVRLPAGFIRRYVEVATQRTDAPVEAHTLAAVVVLSALAGPQVRLPLAYKTDGVRLGFWAMNVVDSTSGRKTTVNEFAVDVIRQVLGEDAILPWKGSPEAFIQALAQRDGKTAVFARDEYTGLLAGIKKGGYVAGLAQDFIRAYDGLPITMGRTAKMNRKTGQRVDDTDRVREPYLVKLCAATRTSFVETATIEDVLDGLLARFVFTSGTAEERRAQPMTPAIEEAWRSVVDLARGFHERAGELLRITVPEVVLDLNWELEKRYKAAALAHPRPDAARPAMKRLGETVLKVAALLAIDRTTAGVTSLEPRDLEAAEAMAECWQATTLDIITDLGRTRFQARADKVLGTIRAHPKGIMLSALYRAHRDLGQREFDEVLGALDTQRLIHSVQVQTGKAGRPPVVYFPGPPTEAS